MHGAVTSRLSPLPCAAPAYACRLDSSSVGDSTMNAAFLNEGLSDSVHSWEVQLVLEYCDKGSLRALLNKQGTFALPGMSLAEERQV